MSRDMLYPSIADLTNSVRSITAAATDFKTSIFKAKMRGEAIDSEPSKKFLRNANEFLRRWDTYASNLADAMKASKGDEDVITVDYGDVKNYIFAKYDYAAVLPFADGIFKGVKDGKFEEPDDIKDFHDHTVDKAFPDLADSVAGLVDDVVGKGMGFADSHKVGKLGLSKYQSVRQSGKLFNDHDRAELYRAVQKTVEYLVEHMDDLQINGAYSGTRLYVSAVNNIIDFCVYSMVAFTMRVVVIARYAIPFINASTTEEDSDSDKDSGPVVESVQKLPDEHYNCTDCIHVLRDADDARLKAPACVKEFVDTFAEFLTAVGCVVKVGRKPTFEDPYVDGNMREGNRFYEKLKDNPIFDMISKYGYRLSSNIRNGNAFFNELVVTMRDYMYDHKLAVPNNNSPREEFLHVIRGVDADQQSVKAYQQLAYELYIVVVETVMNMNTMIQDITRAEIAEKNNPTTNAGTANDCAECLRIMNYVYREFTSAYLQKGRYIEAKINFLKEENLNKTIAGMQIHIPGLKPDEPSINDYMMTAIPDTTKMPIDLSDLYALPVFEDLQMYDIALRYRPEFLENMYLSEAVGLSNIINAIIAAIQGALNRFRHFWNDKSVQAAVKWVTEYGDGLTRMNCSGHSLDVLPYKDDIKFGEHAKKIIDGIKAIDAKDFQSASAEDMKKAVIALYPSEAVYKFWDGENPKASAQKYRNFLLFQNEQNVNDQPVTKVTYSDQVLQAKLRTWVDTVKAAKNTFDAYDRLSKDLDTAVKALKNKVASAANQQNNQTQQQNAQTGNNVEPPPGNPPTEPPKTQNGQSQSDSKANEQTTVMNTTLADIQSAIARIWVPATDMFVEYIKAHYNYLKQAYGILHQGQAAPNNGQNQSPQNAQ